MAAREPSASFVERHGLWTDEQTRAAKAVVQAIKKNKLELVRFSFADQHGVLRGKTVDGAGCARPDAQRRHHDDDAARQGHRAQDRVSGVHARRRLRHGGNAGRRRFRHGRRPGDIPRAAVGAEYRLAALRHLFHQRQAGAVLDAAGSARRAGAARDGGVRFPRRPRSRISSVQAGESAARAGRTPPGRRKRPR